jgi:hypothetical protein
MQIDLTYVEAEALLTYLAELVGKWPKNAPAGHGTMWTDEQKAVYRAFKKLDRAALYEFKSYAGLR